MTENKSKPASVSDMQAGIEHNENDLGFIWHTAKNGELEIRHRGKYATKFSGTKAQRYSEELEQSTFAQQQQLMARLTGNYKRGNERTAKNHPRNTP